MTSFCESYVNDWRDSAYRQSREYDGSMKIPLSAYQLGLNLQINWAWLGTRDIPPSCRIWPIGLRV